jgi:hypothetical protein
MGFWVSLYFNHEQVRKEVKGSHMPIVSLSSFFVECGVYACKIFSTFVREIN